MHKRVISEIKRVEFISDRMSYITQSGRWCDFTVLDVQAPTQDESDGMMDSFFMN